MTAVDITMPRLSDSMEEGTVARWLVAPGASIAKGQPLVEIDTDKATVVYEADAAGTLLEVFVAEGESASIGAPIARVGDPGDAADQAQTDTGRSPSASPVARRLASEFGLDLGSIAGTGPGGMVTREDVEQAKLGVRADDGPAPLTLLQRTVARRMVEGASAPTFSAAVEVDLTAALELRATIPGDTAPSLNDFVVKAVALALRNFPRLNGFYGDDGFHLHDRVDIGIAVADVDALMVPVIRNADAKSVTEIAAAARTLADKVRARTISPAELDGGTFTITNLGMLGVRTFVPILNPPQAGILSVGAAILRPTIDDDGSVVGRRLASLTLVCDHRIVYGAEAARFLAELRGLLEQPTQLVA